MYLSVQRQYVNKATTAFSYVSHAVVEVDDRWAVSERLVTGIIDIQYLSERIASIKQIFYQSPPMSMGNKPEELIKEYCVDLCFLLNGTDDPTVYCVKNTAKSMWCLRSTNMPFYFRQLDHALRANEVNRRNMICDDCMEAIAKTLLGDQLVINPG